MGILNLHMYQQVYYTESAYRSSQLMERTCKTNGSYLPKRSQDLVRKKFPLIKSSLFFRTCSTFSGELTTIAGGREGTRISIVSKPTAGSTSANHSSNL